MKIKESKTSRSTLLMTSFCNFSSHHVPFTESQLYFLSQMAMARNSSNFTLFLSFLFLNCFFTLCLSTDDKSVLLAIKANIIDHSHISLTTWSATSNTSICSWIGITCDFKNQRVTALNLSAMNLTGTLAPVIGDLSFLTLLDLSFNNFSGSMPKELSHLKHLQYLRLFNNSFTGTIPASLGNLTQLNTLNLRYNQLMGMVPAAIFDISSLIAIDLTSNRLHGTLPVDICTYLPKLERFHLSVNQFEGRIPSSVHKCKELEYLSLSYNEFSGGIPKEIGNLTRLKLLFLGYNNLGGGIPVELGNLKHLEVLNVASSSLKGPIPSSIFNMTSLKGVSFQDNNLSGSIPVDIHNNVPVLEELYLDRNQLTGQIPLHLWDYRGLRIISLEENKFVGNLSNKVANLTYLKVLDLSDNNFTGTIPREIGDLNLESIFLTGNSLTGLIPTEIFNISTLIQIGLVGNSFSGHLPLSLGLWLPNLQTLYLSGNSLSGPIPVSISNASKLTIIAMTSNSFTGSIPNTLGNLKHLRRLLIGENNLTGLTFFDSLSNCKDLDLLSISLNQFNANFPASVGNLSTSLKIFEAFGSKIKGEIPVGIGNLSSLTSLVLDSNELTGFIPSTLGRLEYLERVYLEHNNLQGFLPGDLCRLKRLGDLYVSHNKLNGSVPSCLGELKNMRRLFLDSNNLNSKIPSTLWSLEDLLYLNLSTNSLTGNLLPDIKNLKMITQLDLSWNLFSGVIPSSIGSNQMLTFLSLAHNKLQESIPQSFGNLISLETLDLSENNLSGSIPRSLEALRYLEYFDVSFNRLQGEIPTGGCFGNFTAKSFIQNEGLCGVSRLQVKPCHTGSLGRSQSRIVFVSKYIFPPIIAAILFVALIFVYMRRPKRKMELPNQEDLDSVTNWRRFTYAELLKATNGFSESNLIGVGGIGSVYKGTLFDEVNVAVKVFNTQLEAAYKSFDVECEVLRNIRHRNITTVISSCSSQDFLALVLEYMPNGSLENWLYSHNYCLSMMERLNIMIDVASALEYLHHGHTKPILHCDLKPSNVLLDKDMTGHVCDFSIAKLLGEDEFLAQTKTLATIGYMAPEYGREGIVSTQGDVYSYGILLMETFTRKKPTDELFSEKMTMRSWISEALLGSIVEVVDANLMVNVDESIIVKKECDSSSILAGIESEDFSVNEECTSSILQLALDCSTDVPSKRISIENVVVRLNKIKIILLSNTGKSVK